MYDCKFFAIYECETFVLQDISDWLPVKLQMVK